MKVVKAVTIAALLAGCAETVKEPDVLRDEISARANAAQAMTDRITAQADTFLMPTSGTARFTGYGLVSADTSPSNATAVGTAQMDANFASGTLSGQVNNFIGQGSDGSDQRFAGAVTLSNGVIGASSQNSLDLVYNGAIQGNNDRIIMDGNASGGFVGAGATGLAAFANNDTMLVNGSPTTGTFILLGER